jgi:hypothetical protein
MNDKPASASDDGLFLGKLRELAAELRHVRARVEAFRASLGEVSEDPKDSHKADALKAKDRLRHALDVNRPQIDALVASLAAEARRDAGVADYWGDQVTAVENLCEEAFYLLDGELETTYLPAVAAVKEVIDHLDEALRTTEYVTVPPRLNQYLKNYRNGQVLRFDRTFSDEVRPDDMDAMLTYLADQPRSVNGIIDVKAKTVTKVSPNASRHGLTFAIPHAPRRRLPARAAATRRHVVDEVVVHEAAKPRTTRRRHRRDVSGRYRALARRRREAGTNEARRTGLATVRVVRQLGHLGGRARGGPRGRDPLGRRRRRVLRGCSR